MIVRTVALASLAGVAAGCVKGGDAPVGPPPPPCTGTCVPDFAVNPHHLIITVGDTARFVAHPKTADGAKVPISWLGRGGITANMPVSVDANGVATGLLNGKGYVDARSPTDTGTVGRSEIWVVSPDTSAQPFIAVYRDAATGDTLPYLSSFVGHDSIDAVLSYVVGLSTLTLGAPELVVKIRKPDVVGELFSVSVPAPVRGRGAFATVRLNLTEKDSRGARRYPQGGYDLYVLLPLADGRTLGDQTGYRVVF
jgi:hypothetical protein